MVEIVQAKKRRIREIQRDIKVQNDFDKLKITLGLIEREGILRCKGKLENASLPTESMTPSPLPRNNRFLELVILEAMIEHCIAGQIHHWQM